MAENDVYNNKSRYEYFKKNVRLLLTKHEKKTERIANGYKHYCKNPENIDYFKKLFLSKLHQLHKRLVQYPYSAGIRLPILNRNMEQHNI